MMTGIPRPNISAIESGKREVSLTTLRLLAANLRTTPGALVDGVAPIHFKKTLLSRKSLEEIAQASLGKKIAHLTPEQKDISFILSNIIKNKINANKARYRNTLKGPKTYVNNWMMLKATLGSEAMNNLLARIDKYESKAD